MIANILRVSPVLVLSIACFLTAGCESTKETGAVQKRKVAAKSVKPVPKGLSVPKDLFVYAGSSKPTDAMAALTAIANKVQPGLPNPAMMVPAMLQQKFRLTSPSGIDIKKPIAIALFDPKVYGRDPSATLLGMTSKAQFEASLPQTEQKKNDQGNAYSYAKWKGAKYPVYINFIKDHAVLTRHKDLFAKQSAFIEKLAKHSFPERGSVYVSVKNSMLAHGDMAKKAAADMKVRIGAAMAQTPTAQGSEMVSSMLDGAVQFADNMDGIEAVLGLKPDGIKIDIRFQPKMGTSLAKTWAKLDGGEHEMLKSAAPDSVAFASLSMKNPDGVKMLSALFRSMVSTMATSDIMGPDLTASIEKALGDLEKSLAGSMLFFVHSYPQTLGLSPTMAFNVKDSKAAQSALSAVGTQLSTNPKAAARYAELGIKVDYQSSAYQVGSHSVAVQKTAILKPNPAMALMSDLLEQHMAVTDTMGIVAYGAAAKAEIKAMVENKYSGLQKKAGVDYVLKNGAIAPLLQVYISPIEIMQRGKLGGMNPYAATLAGIQSTSGIGISAGKFQSGMQIVINVPTGLLKDGMNAFMKIKGGL